MLQSGELTAGHGRALLMCKEHTARRRLAREARDGGWSVRETERRAKAAQAGGAGEGRGRSQVVIHPDLAELLRVAEEALSEALGRDFGW